VWQQAVHAIRRTRGFGLGPSSPRAWAALIVIGKHGLGVRPSVARGIRARIPFVAGLDKRRCGPHLDAVNPSKGNPYVSAYSTARVRSATVFV